MSANRLPIVIVAGLLFVFVTAPFLVTPGQAIGAPAPLPVPGAASATATSGDGLPFIEIAGQWPDAARFQVWGGGQTLWLAEDALWLTLVERAAVGTLDRAPVDTLAGFDSVVVSAFTF